MSLCIGSLCCAKLCLGGWGAPNTYLLPKAAEKLIFHSHFCENCFWYPYSSVGLWGSQECSLSSCAWNDVVILVGSPPLSLSSPCCSSLFSAHAQSTCFMFPLLHSCFLASVLNQFIIKGFFIDIILLILLILFYYLLLKY